ncbi:hypothetical protein F5Y06DRAFT_302673 [Hypoxylon sp. FL0890]|nr:hypothetical protein F5Y06DRAFT_302673 [Hypoxylon sp. FL0890]
MATQTSRFLSLPLEIRQAIYRETLRPYEARQKNAGPQTSSRRFVLHRMDTEILRVNRQVSKEAYEVMLKSHMFIRIVTRGVDLKDVFYNNPMPVLSMDKGLVRRCKALAMTHGIIRHDTSATNYHLLIVCKDLDLFCRCLAEGESRIDGFGADTIHTIILHDPFTSTSTPNYLNVTNQERLLQPYKEHIRGFPSFRLTGDVDPSLANILAAEIRRPVKLDHRALLQDLLTQNDLAKNYDAIGNSDMALDTLDKVCNQIRCLGSRTAWAVMKNKQGTEFAKAFTEIFFMLNLGRVVATVGVLKKIAGDHSRTQSVRSQKARVYRAVKAAVRSATVLGTQWQISDQQEGELALQLAITHRLAADDLTTAEHYIESAAALLPGSIAVATERQRIARWRERLYSNDAFEA